MDTVTTYVEKLPHSLRQDLLVSKAAAAIDDMAIDATRDLLLRSMAIKRAKPYLHAVETEELREISLDDDPMNRLTFPCRHTSSFQE